MHVLYRASILDFNFISRPSDFQNLPVRSLNLNLKIIGYTDIIYFYTYSNAYNYLSEDICYQLKTRGDSYGNINVYVIERAHTTK